VRCEKESRELRARLKKLRLGVEQCNARKNGQLKLLFKRSQSMTTTTAVKSAAKTPIEAEPVKLQKRIGSTVYSVCIRFSEKETETLEDKIFRLIENDPLVRSANWPDGQTEVRTSA
jgi:hypothetical protein